MAEVADRHVCLVELRAVQEPRPLACRAYPQPEADEVTLVALHERVRLPRALAHEYSSRRPLLLLILPSLNQHPPARVCCRQERTTGNQVARSGKRWGRREESAHPRNVGQVLRRTDDVGDHVLVARPPP